MHPNRAQLPSLLLALLTGFAGSTALGQTVTLSASKDNTLFEDGAGLLSNGAGPYMFAGTTANDTLRRGLISFDLSAIPAGSIITGATLTMHMSRTISTAEPLSLHRATAAWGEGASFAFGEGGNGAPAEPGDATWLHTLFSTAFWGNPGGDFAPVPSTQILVSGNGFYSWGLSGDLIADVQQWLDAPASNMGWVMVGSESFPGTAKRFDTREHPDPALRPALEVQYQIPAPGSIAFFGLLAWGTCRRKRLK